jgi:CubicO group peptidase (beta-lactamase class C family)
MEDPELRELLQDHAGRHSVPGAAVAVLHDGEVASASTGVADVTTGEPVDADTRFAIGSVTKPMTATVIAGLAAGGRLGLDDPIADHVPELAENGWAGSASVRDLLANTSRVPLRAAWEFELEDDGDDALARCGAAVATGEPAPPMWSYANIGWCLAGRIIETITGRSWERAMRSHLLGPATMTQTTFALSPAAEPRARGHEIAEGGRTPVKPWNPRAYCSSGTSLLSTVTDLVRFASWHLEDPSCAVLRETHAEVAIYGWLDVWCLGWARFDWGADPIIGWDGVMPGQRTVLRILPERRAVVALTTNGATGRSMYRSFFAELFEDRFDVRIPALQLTPAAGAAGDLARFAGTFAWPDRRCEVKADGDVLLIEVDGRRVEARPTTDRTFLVDERNPDNPTVTFAGFDDEGRPRIIYLMLWGLPRTGVDA